MAAFASALSPKSQTFRPGLPVKKSLRKRRDPLTLPRHEEGIEDDPVGVHFLPPQEIDKLFSTASLRESAVEQLFERFTLEEAMIVDMIFIKGYSAEVVADAFCEEVDVVRRCVIQALSRVRKEVRR